MNKKTWYQYYKQLAGSRLGEQRFCNKHLPFLQEVRQALASNPCGLEVGGGTGLVSKLVYKPGVALACTDKNLRMLQLARKNISPRILLFKHNIFSRVTLQDGVLFSHGVLEHFSTKQIKKIRTRLSTSGCTNIHYVPTNKYKHKSFGDEHLWSYKKWVRLLRPNRYIMYNGGKDMVLIW